MGDDGVGAGRLEDPEAMLAKAAASATKDGTAGGVGGEGGGSGHWG